MFFDLLTNVSVLATGAEVAAGFAIAGMITSAAGIGISMYQSSVASEQAEINARYSAMQKNRQADILEQKKSLEEAEALRESRRKLASMEAQYASTGLQIQGTPMDYLLAQAEADEKNLAYQNWNYDERISSLRIGAENDIILGQATSDSLLMSGVADTTKGLGSLSMQYATFAAAGEKSKSDVGKGDKGVSGGAKKGV